MEINKGYIYYSSQTTVYRQKLIPGDMLPDPKVEIIVDENHEKKSREHIAKPMAFDNKGNMYVPFGAPSNACQDPKRTPGAPGLDPCPQLEYFGGVWKFDADKLNQSQDDGEKFATGIRSLVCLEWNDQDNQLYSVMHGRDDLLRLFPEHFSPWQSALLPAEEFIMISKGSDYGWPYCYYDQMINKKVLAPEYGGDGVIVGQCSDYDNPILGFPGHWAPNGLLFYRGDQFPERYKEGAFVAFHGSTNRAPYPQAGYFVGFIPFEDGAPKGIVQIFADGFARVDTIVNVRDAVFRPMGLAEGPDGSLYVSETEKGAIWKIEFKGDKQKFGTKDLLKMKMRENLPHFKTPDIEKSRIMINEAPEARLYNTYCATCHQTDGMGDMSRFPPLSRSEWVLGDKEVLIGIILNGQEGEMEVLGRTYNNVMPQHDFLSNQQISEILNYIRTNFRNDASKITPQEVAEVRAKLSSKKNEDVAE
jgi:glucose/arabinose dehydrogenase